MTSEGSGYATRELSTKTWPDFERLFLKQGLVGDGWDCWCTFHHVSSFSLPENKQPPSRAGRAVRNRLRKRELVEKGCAHGILVYAKGEPVGWCQYGPREELPRIDNTIKYRKLSLSDSGEKLWRITCFVVDKQYRRRGVASAGLKAALEAIRKKGGGLVEAYPVSKTRSRIKLHVLWNGLHVREGRIQDDRSLIKRQNIHRCDAENRMTKGRQIVSPSSGGQVLICPP